MSLQHEERQAAYDQWAQRLKSRRQEKLDSIHPPTSTATASKPTWSPADLFETSSARLQQVRISNLTTMEKLALFELKATASQRELTLAYRRFAKVHHPDRWVMADHATARGHERTMRRLSEAYHHLRSKGW